MNISLVCRNKQKSYISDLVFNEHKRTVNRVCFHTAEPHILLSGSQDGSMKLFVGYSSIL